MMAATQRFLLQNVIKRNLHFNARKCLPLKYLTQEAKQQFDEDGYTIAHGILSEEEVNQAREALQGLIERTRDLTTDKGTCYELAEGHKREKPSVHRVRFPSVQHKVFDDIQKHPHILDCIEDVLGPSFRYIPQDKLNVKQAGHGAAVRWHQDWAFYPHTNDSILTASLLLFDTTRENGCLQVVPKSHKGPIVSHFDASEQFVSVITDRNYKPDNVAYLEGKAGSVTFHHIRVVHGSARNFSNIPRSTVCNLYSAMDAWPLVGVTGSDFKNFGPVDFEQFDKTRLRGDRCITPRLANIPVVLPIPLDQASTVFDMTHTAAEPEP